MNKTKGKTTKKKGKKGTFNRNKAYEVVTERFIKYIEEHGVMPWRKPWMVVHPDITPTNYSTKEPYHGVNVFLLMMSGYESPYWLTYKQAEAMGGQVREKEKGTPVIKFQPPDKNKIKAIEEDDSLSDEEKAERKRKLFGFYRVSWAFNEAQIDGIEFPEPEKVDTPILEFTPYEQAERTLDSMPNPPHIGYGPARAYYNRMSDSINLPPKELFETVEDYYSTLFHELAHSTGHKSRLNRFADQKIVAFGSRDYSFEELVAELSSSFVMNELGIETKDTELNSASYLAGWVRTMKSDQKMLLKAMNKAIPATEYIFGRLEPKGGNHV
jgi:antirestriction protein ArdC